MAKDNNTKYSASQEDSMKSKVEIKQPLPQNQEKISRLVGSVFIGMGILLVAFGIFSFIKFREEPLLDPELEAPAAASVTSITNDETIVVKGEAKGYDSIFVYVNEEKVGEAKVGDDAKYSFEYTVEEQGEYSIAVAGVKGFPNRYISPMSESKISVVDYTSPDKDTVTIKYGPETNKDTFILIGTTEADATIEVKRGTESFEGLADKEGKFRIEGITLDEGKNVFSVYITDLAGNQVLLDEKVRITYSASGDVNGDAVIDEDIPQAAGTFDEIFGNQLMMLFGIIALLAFSTSSTFVYLKNRK
ncbi:MAG: hypothetical protein UR61_C0040G0005 [candidate division WS6 bacterium GW2011_GWE1_34_7]|uniref:Bacterial Ig domain-containing protein n=1 Tax=candidate division WS6 bacterium GW2011_GWE1_34_7 TaxID=1619093 RepID=A0A0G0EBJ3_9BACT|nr:MAG: hypothetical protein UR61_C0040G0005 [candidate division WS6 bacterium GW2011_GWE1_34_7]